MLLEKDMFKAAHYRVGYGYVLDAVSNGHSMKEIIEKIPENLEQFL